jgi:hypothetical protein
LHPPLLIARLYHFVKVYSKQTVLIRRAVLLSLLVEFDSNSGYKAACGCSLLRSRAHPVGDPTRRSMPSADVLGSRFNGDAKRPSRRPRVACSSPTEGTAKAHEVIQFRVPILHLTFSFAEVNFVLYKRSAGEVGAKSPIRKALHIFTRNVL